MSKDEGVETVSRNSDIPKIANLSANEISLCHELLKMQSQLSQSVKADITTRENCTEVEALAVGPKKRGAFMSTDIDSLANIVARKLTKGDLSIPKMIDSVGNRPAFKVPTQSTTSGIALDTKKGGDRGTVLWDGLSEWPTSGIQKPGDNDCLIGRGGA